MFFSFYGIIVFKTHKYGVPSAMKTLLSLITALAASCVVVAGVAAILVLYGAELLHSCDSSSFLGGLLLAAFGLSTLTGLVTSIAAALLGLPLTLLHLLLKRWVAALLSLLSCLSGAALWLFFATSGG